MKVFTLNEASVTLGLEQTTIITYIEREWITPGIEVSDTRQLDEEDVARLHLILELQRDFGANDESIPLILHLMDQVHYLRNQIKKIPQK